MNVIIPAPQPVAHPGLAEALAMFRALTETPKETKAFLDAMKASQDRYDQQLKAYGSVKEIERLRADAEAQLTEAHNAKAQADEVRKAAEVDAAQVRRDADAFRAQVQGEAEKVAVDLKGREAAFALRVAQFSQDQNSFETNMQTRKKACEEEELRVLGRIEAVVARETAVNLAIERLTQLGIKVEF